MSLSALAPFRCAVAMVGYALTILISPLTAWHDRRIQACVAWSRSPNRTDHNEMFEYSTAVHASGEDGSSCFHTVAFDDSIMIFLSLVGMLALFFFSLYIADNEEAAARLKSAVKSTGRVIVSPFIAIYNASGRLIAFHFTRDFRTAEPMRAEQDRTLQALRADVEQMEQESGKLKVEVKLFRTHLDSI